MQPTTVGRQTPHMPGQYPPTKQLFADGHPIPAPDYRWFCLWFVNNYRGFQTNTPVVAKSRHTIEYVSSKHGLCGGTRLFTHAPFGTFENFKVASVAFTRTFEVAAAASWCWFCTMYRQSSELKVCSWVESSQRKLFFFKVFCSKFLFLVFKGISIGLLGDYFCTF